MERKQGRVEAGGGRGERESTAEHAVVALDGDRRAGAEALLPARRAVRVAADALRVLNVPRQLLRLKLDALGLFSTCLPGS